MLHLCFYEESCHGNTAGAGFRLSCHLAAALLDAFRAPVAPEPLSPRNRRRSGVARPFTGHQPPAAEPRAPPADQRRHEAALEWVCGITGCAALQLHALCLLERLLAAEPGALPALRRMGALILIQT